jgi:hypothetical protein
LPSDLSTIAQEIAASTVFRCAAASLGQIGYMYSRLLAGIRSCMQFTSPTDGVTSECKIPIVFPASRYYPVEFEVG